MSDYPRKINRAAAERLLRGEPADPRHPHDLLAVLLATAAAPAQAGEPAGEEAAVAAFRDARPAGAYRTTRPAKAIPGTRSAGASHGVRRTGDPRMTRQRPWTPHPSRRWARRPVQLAVVALTATTAGGIALAAGTATRPQDPAGDGRGTASATASQRAGAAGTGRGPSGSPATPEPSMAGLCRAAEARQGTTTGKALDSPAFRSLVNAAGGKDKVPGYCASVLGPQSSKNARDGKGRPSARPTHTGQPHGAQPNTRTGRPDTRTGPGRTPGPATRAPSRP